MVPYSSHVEMVKFYFFYHFHTWMFSVENLSSASFIKWFHYINSEMWHKIIRYSHPRRITCHNLPFKLVSIWNQHNFFNDVFKKCLFDYGACKNESNIPRHVSMNYQGWLKLILWVNVTRYTLSCNEVRPHKWKNILNFES